MKHKEHYTDEMLNAYLDGELDKEDTQRLLEALNSNAQLSQRLCELGRVRSLVQFAYHDVADSHTQDKPRGPVSRKLIAVAASLTLAIGVSLGWVTHQYYSPPPSLLELANHVEQNNPHTNTETWRVLLHLTTDNPKRLKVVLDEAEALLAQYAQTNQSLEMQILANDQGLNLLRADTSAYSQRVKAMQARYKNLAFVACGTALKRLQDEKKLNVQLLPDVTVAPSALGEVMRKQSEGWTYIKI